MTLNVFIIPNAKQNQIVGWVEGALRIRIAAPPIEGRANGALIDFLANTLHLAPSEITLEKGQGSKHKRLSVPLTKAELILLLA